MRTIFIEQPHIYQDRELKPIKNPQETGEWLLAMLCVALEKNKGNEEYVEFLKKEAWEK